MAWTLLDVFLSLILIFFILVVLFFIVAFVWAVAHAARKRKKGGDKQ